MGGGSGRPAAVMVRMVAEAGRISDSAAEETEDEGRAMGRFPEELRRALRAQVNVWKCVQVEAMGSEAE